MPEPPLLEPSLQRTVVEGFACPLGAYPIRAEELRPIEGYLVEFEPADASTDEEWDEWPDRYVYDVVITHTRLAPLLRALFTLFPSRVYPIVDALSEDAYREIDPYLAYEVVGLDRFLQGYRRWRPWLLEDGCVGFGAMSREPFLFVYVDDHKILTLRAEGGMRQRVERVLAAFDLKPVTEPAGPDAAEHEHRDTLPDPTKNPEATTREDIVDDLRDAWRLTLNIDPDTNVDDDGAELGLTAWRCLVADPTNGKATEVLLVAGSLAQAEQLALEAVFPDGTLPDPAPEVYESLRLLPDELAAELKAPDAKSLMQAAGVRSSRPLT
ncbi:MAG: hypothetical protein AB7G17_00195 [Phycisphaerales bacterium]